MMTSNINFNNSPIMLQAIALNKALLKLTIEQLEDEILAFEDVLSLAINHPEESPSIPFNTIKEKISKLNELQAKLDKLE